MSSDEIRLWRWPDGGFRPKGADADPQYIALPAARHAALMRVVEAAVELASFMGEPDESGFYGEVNGPLLDAMRAAVDAYLATAPSRQGEAPRA